MKFWKLVSLVIVAIVVGGMVYGYSVIRRGFSARGTPSAIETFVATTARRLAVPSNDRRLRNPFPASPENIQAGMKHFADHCATCHANDGSGNTLLGKGLYPKPPDMRTAETQNKSDGELYYTIENGVRLTGMPAFGEEHSGSSGAETWHLVLFIRHLPQITPEELTEMKKLNPKTEADRASEEEAERFLNEGIAPQPHEQMRH